MSDLRAFEPWRRDFGRDLGELRGLEQGALLGFGFLFCWSFLLRYYFVAWAFILHFEVFGKDSMWCFELEVRSEVATSDLEWRRSRVH